MYLWLALPVLASLGCERTAAQAPDAPTAVDAAADQPAEAEAPDAEAPDAEAPDAAVDDADASDAQVPCALDVAPPDASGTLYGYLRFANLVRGAGTLRFIARSLPMFSPAYVEAVVPEGQASEQIRTLPVAYEVRVVPAPDAAAGYTADATVTDAGMFTDGAATPPALCTADAGPGEFVAPTCTDVYFLAGCTVVLAGSREGDVAAQRDRRLWRISDVPARSNDCYTGRVRTLGWYAEGPAVDVDGPGALPLARNAAYHEISGTRSVGVGPLRVSVRSNDTGASLGEHLAGTVIPGHTHTLHVWGDARDTATPGVSTILLDDISPTFR
jgi:hypothetical protein